MSDYKITLPLEVPWIEAYWKEYLKARSAPAEFIYLFTSRSAIKKRQPVTSDYCRRKLQSHVAKILGHTITVNGLERGSLKAMALRFGYDAFMERVQNVPLSKRTKWMVWLQRYSNTSTDIKPHVRFKRPRLAAPEGNLKRIPLPEAFERKVNSI